MRRAFYTLIFLFGLVPISAASAQQRADQLAAISWLVGEWTGVGVGQPGTSATVRHNQRIHNDRFIKVEARSDYPPRGANTIGEVHTSTDVWSFDRRRGLLVMRQFDSLGFAMTYVQDAAASTNGRIVLVSEQLENVPAGWRARYTYEHPASNEYRELFELDSGNGYERYVSNSFRRTEPSPAH